MGDTYSKVQESNDIANYQELTEMIIEIEKLMFWKKEGNGKEYLHQCDFLTGNDASSDKIVEKVKVLKTQLGGIEESIKYVKDRVKKNDIQDMDANIQILKKEQEEMMTEFKDIIERNNSLLEKISWSVNET